jgi:segregation and condensation protein A
MLAGLWIIWYNNANIIDMYAQGAAMVEPKYRLEGIVRTKSEFMEDFEGPLDVIFLLLSKNKIEIQDVSITAILEQYLAYLEEMKRLDIELASEFITMASHLMLIKTKMLLSKAEALEAETELDLLRQSLIERQRHEAMDQIRMAITALEPMNEIGRCLFTKAPEPLRRDTTYRYQHDVMDMLWALDEITERNQRRLPPPTVNFKGIVGKEPYPVTKKAKELIHSLILRGVQKLKSLFKGSRSRSEIVATFLAILELCKTNSVTLEDDVTGENPNIRLLDESGLAAEGVEENGTN